ncbi:MAG: phenylalanine--tRNA ligase subunit beta [Bdellovibrionota bacterium]
MKISLKWLGDYIEVSDYASKPQELAALLTAAGLEVEGIENLSKTFDFVVVGNILKKDRHPNADRLTLCQVATGDGVVHQIVCGATNHNEGDNVVVALPGAVLPGNFAIKRSKIRDVESSGMLCSLKELGLATESEGIMILPKDAPVGQPFAKYKGMDDILFELKVTPNRADCLSHFGLAREIGCLLGREVKFPIESITEDGGSTRDQMKIDLKAVDMAPRYTGRGVTGVKVGPSPDWLKKRLESIGMNSINNVVDATNYVMMELGQPLHAFDATKIKGLTIVIDHAVAGEKFTTLDGTELTLDGSELTIRDAERAVVLAGVIGGKNSGVDDETKEVFIEAAYFNPSSIRRTARKYGIETDSSYRFARGTNPEAVPLALNRAAQLIQKVAGGKIMGDALDSYPKPLAREAIEISLSRLSDRIGIKVDASEFETWMKRLGCDVKFLREDADGPSWSIRPPIFRWDLSVDMDLVEEFARLHGYQHIPESLPPLAVAPAIHDVQFTGEVRLRRLLQAEGCLQAVNYAFVSKTFQEKFLGDVEKLQALGLKTPREAVLLINPLNEEIGAMRTSLLPGLMKNLIHNSRQGNSFGRVFELGFSHSSEKSDAETKYNQDNRMAFAFWGAPDNLWSKGSSAPVIFELKGVIERLLNQWGVRRFKWVAIDRGAPDFVHPGQAAALHVEGKAIGFIGTLHPQLNDEHKVRETCAIAEFCIEKLFALSARALNFEAVSKMPAVDRDLAFVMPKELAVADIETEIRKTGGDLLKDVRVFDVFEGGSLEAGQRSVAFRLLFQAKDSTLEDQAINELRDRVVNAVKAKFGVALRS